jgi:hypothetical protein
MVTKLECISIMQPFIGMNIGAAWLMRAIVAQNRHL